MGLVFGFELGLGDEAHVRVRLHLKDPLTVWGGGCSLRSTTHGASAVVHPCRVKGHKPAQLWLKQTLRPRAEGEVGASQGRKSHRIVARLRAYGVFIV